MKDNKLKIDNNEFATFLKDYIDFNYLNDLKPVRGAGIGRIKPSVEKIEIIDPTIEKISLYFSSILNLSTQI